MSSDLLSGNNRRAASVSGRTRPADQHQKETTTGTNDDRRQADDDAGRPTTTTGTNDDRRQADDDAGRPTTTPATIDDDAGNDRRPAPKKPERTARNRRTSGNDAGPRHLLKVVGK